LHPRTGTISAAIAETIERFMVTTFRNR
jgi:hypothetical protein